jgi:hypothetical protein
MGRRVRIVVDDLTKLIPSSNTSKLVVYLDGLPLRDTPVTLVGDGQLACQFHQTENSKATWSELLGRANRTTGEYELSVGLENGPLLPGYKFALEVVPPVWLTFYAMLLTVFVGLFVWMARSSNIMRDSVTLPATANVRKPYSLARFQMAVWFFLVFAAFLFIWMITGQYDSITPEVLGLMGIASGTALGAAVIDDNKNLTAANNIADMRPRCDGLWVEMDTLKTKVEQLTAKVGSETPADPKDLDLLNQAKAELATKTALWEQLVLKMKDTDSRKSGSTTIGFLDDLLSDANGYSFHRFQILAWTVVLSILFVRSVWAELAMPKFDPTLLALMGVSAGTFLGFKFPERPSKP